MERKFVLVINPGSTSTKISIYDKYKVLIEKNIMHKISELDKFAKIFDQRSYRLKLIKEWMKEENIKSSALIAVVGRGGLLRAIPSGTYEVSDVMIDDLKNGIQGEHASNLGGILARDIADPEGIRAYIVDPVSVDEMSDIARISGLKEISRRSLTHALNIKAVSIRYADEIKESLANLNLLVVHLGGGISITAVSKGMIIDANNPKEMGPFSADRTGTLPVGDLLKLCFSGEYTEKELLDMVYKRGGLYSYLESFSAKDVAEKALSDSRYKLVFDSMIYQICKEIGAYATVLSGNVDAIILTGGMAHSKYITDKILEMTGFIAKITIYPGEDEMDALNRGALRVISGEEKVKIYENEAKL